MSNIISLLQNKSTHFLKECAYLFLEDGEHETSKLTYGELDQYARAIAAYLLQKKLTKQRVLLVYPTGIDFIIGFFGCLYAGVTAVPVNCPEEHDLEKSAALLNAIALDADISGIFTTTQSLTTVKKCFQDLYQHKELFIEDTTYLLTKQTAKLKLPEIHDDTIAYLQYTSGSTSTPKAAIITHKNLTHSLKSTGKVWSYSKKSITFIWAPHTHVYGLVCGLLLPIFYGGLAILIPPAAFIRKPIVWLQAISKYKVTHSGCPNFGYDLCNRDINAAQLADIHLESWQVAVNGGEQVQKDTLLTFCEKFNACGFNIQQFCSVYGMSELSGAIASTSCQQEPAYFNLLDEALKNNEVATASQDRPYRTVVSSGVLLPGLYAEVVDPVTLLPVEGKKIGEIWLSGKSMVSGYWRREDETKAVFNASLPNRTKSYFRTGDLGFIKDGELYLVGRLKEQIVLNGKKYYPLDLELTVATATKMFELKNSTRTIFSVPIHNKEELILVEEINHELSPSEIEATITRIRHGLMQNQGIDLYEIVLVKENSIPKTKSGKLQRKLCQEQYLLEKLNVIHRYSRASHHASGLKKLSIHQLAFVQLVATVLNVDVEQIDLYAPLSQYAFDSINIIKLTSSINEKYELTLTPALLFNYHRLIDFYNDYLEKKTTIPLQVMHSPSIHRDDVAIIGISAILPGADNLETFWANLIAEKDCITEIPIDRFDWRTIASSNRWGGFIDHIAQFDATFFNISPREAELIDPQQRLFLQTAWHAIEEAGYASTELAQIKTGLFVGAFTNDYAELLQKHEITDAYITTGLSHAILANRVSYLLNLQGPSEAIDTGCSSSLVAIHHAVSAIQNGDCEMAIVGGVNALITPTLYVSANKAGMLSADGRCKTFDKNANGYVRGEGIVAMVLKPLSKAKADHDHIYAVIKGTAVNHGGHVNSLTVPNPNAQADVIVTACQRAGIEVESIQYIEAHGTGTSLGDPVEVNGLKKAFSLLAKEQGNKILPSASCGLGSLKTHIGHLEAAAGIASVIKVVLAMQHQVLPKNLHFAEINPYIEIENTPFYLVDTTKPWPLPKNNYPRRAGISSFGFGGTNAHIIIEEASMADIGATSSPTVSPYLITLSAKTSTALKQRIHDLYHWLKRQKTSPSLAALSYTLNVGRDHFARRCMMVAHSVSELEIILQQVLLNEHHENFSTNAEDNQPILNHAIDPAIQELVKRYLQGENIDWDALHHGERKRLSLPTYPFAKSHHWISTHKLPSSQFLAESIDHQPSQLLTDSIDLSLVQQDMLLHVAEIIKVTPEEVNLTTSLSQQGFDSIAFAELALCLEEQYGIKLNPTLFFTYHSILDLSQYLWDNYVVALSKVYTASASMTQHQRSSRAISATPSLVVESNQDASEPIAIVGMQAIFPQSKDINAFCENLFASKDMVTEIPIERWDWRHYFGDAKNDPTKTNSKWGGFIPEVKQFDANFFNISAREANLMDPQQRLMLEITWKTIEDAGYDPYSLSEQQVGVFIGAEFSDYQALMTAKNPSFHGYVATGNAHTMLANRISYFFNLHGPSEVIDTACSSSLVAINRAVNALRSKECDVAIAGGVSIILDPDIFVITTQLGVLSADGRCKTFDKTANGYVKGEGVAAILLKPLKEAQQAGDHIYGVILGSAVSHGGKAQSLTAPNAKSQSQLLIKAYKNARVHPETISYIETHGTGTTLGDPIEVEGLRQAFNTLLTKKTALPYCGIGSVKSNIGHLEPASGIAGVIKVLLAMQQEKLPGNLHINELNPLLELADSPFFVVDKTQNWSRLKNQSGQELPRRAGISSFGFGGTNAHLVVEEPPSIPQHNTHLKPYYLLTLSAKQQASLRQKIIDLHDWLSTRKNNIDLESLCFTLNTGRAHFDFRCAIVIESVAELLLSLQALINNQPLPHCISHDVPAANLYEPLFAEIYQLSLKTIEDDKNVSPQIYKHKLLLLGDLYTRRYPIDWHKIHAKESHQRVASLPSYPFIKECYWFDAEVNANEVQSIASDCADKPTDLKQFTLHYLKNIFSEKLNIAMDKIDINATYEVFGIDSLLSLEIMSMLEKEFAPLSKTLLYEKNRISDLANYFQEKHSHALQQLFMQMHPSVSQSANNMPKVRLLPNTHLAATNASEIISEDIAIIGCTGVYPMAQNIDEFWDNLVAGKDCISEVPIERWNYKEHPVLLGGEEKYYRYGGFLADVDKFDPLFFNIAPRDAALIDPQERLFLQSAWDVLEDAGYTRETLQRTVANKVGVFVGVTHHFYPLLIAEDVKENQLPLGIQLFSIANRVSYFLNLNGPSFAIDTACSSSLAAIHLACESIARGECHMAIAGGVNLSLHPRKYHMLGTYGFLSEQGRCASFSAEGSGYVPAEGVGAVLLKPLSHAIRDDDRILGVIKGTSMNQDGKTSGYTVPNPTAQAELIKNTLRKAQVDPRTLSYVEAHGTGTVLGDPIEISGLQGAFAEFTQDKQFCAIGSVKSNIGHLESAAGISQLTKVLLQMQHKKLVPSIHSQNLNPYIDFSQTAFYVQRELTDWETENNQPRRAGISSFGAGGTNVHVIVEEFMPSSQDKKIELTSWIFLLSAFNLERLQAYAQKMYAYLLLKKKALSEMELNAWLTQACYTLQIGREAMAGRLAIHAHSYHDLLTKLKFYLDNAHLIPGDNTGLKPYELTKEIGISFNPVKNSYAEEKYDLNHEKLLQSWLAGHTVAWQKLYAGKEPQRIAMPTYPFAKRPCWVSSQPLQPVETKAAVVALKPVPEKMMLPNVDRDEVMRTLLNIVSQLLELTINEIDQHIPYQDYGLDSMMGINFVAELDKHYPSFISPMDLYRYTTLNQLADYIALSYQPAGTTDERLMPIDDEESQFLNNIAHLHPQEVIQLLENEYKDLEKLM